jgi:hypothetical protein
VVGHHKKELTVYIRFRGEEGYAIGLRFIFRIGDKLKFHPKLIISLKALNDLVAATPHDDRKIANTRLFGAQDGSFDESEAGHLSKGLGNIPFETLDAASISGGEYDGVPNHVIPFLLGLRKYSGVFSSLKNSIQKKEISI